MALRGIPRTPRPAGVEKEEKGLSGFGPPLVRAKIPADGRRFGKESAWAPFL